MQIATPVGEYREVRRQPDEGEVAKSWSFGLHKIEANWNARGGIPDEHGRMDGRGERQDDRWKHRQTQQPGFHDGRPDDNFLREVSDHSFSSRGL